MLIVHAGNRPDEDGRTVPRLPAAQLGSVTAVLAHLLATLQPSGVVTAGAAGADLLLVEAAQRVGIAVHLVIPIVEEQFVERSVADAGASWLTRWEQVRAALRADPASNVTMSGLAANGEWYLEANGILIATAGDLAAATGQSVLALAVRPPEGEDPPSATDDFVAKALAAGLLVVSLDPRPAATRNAAQLIVTSRTTSLHAPRPPSA